MTDTGLLLILHVSLFDSWLHVKTLVHAPGMGVIKVGCKSIYCQQTEKNLAMIGAVLRMPKSVALGCMVLVGGLTSLACKLAKATCHLSVLFQNNLLHDIKPLTNGEVVFAFIQNNQQASIFFEQGLTNKTSRASYRLLSV